MAEETGQEKTEQPTQRRLTEARDEGRVPRSQELSSAAVVLAGAAGAVWLGGSALAAGTQGTLRHAAGWLSAGPFTEISATTLLRDVMRDALFAIGPLLLTIVAAALALNAVQARGVMSFAPVTPDFSRVDPFAGLRRLVSVQSLFTLFKSVAKLTVLGAITWLALASAWPRITELTGADPALVLLVTRSTALKVVLWSGFGFFVLALVDYGFEVWQHQKRLRMTRQELIQEHKETDGNPMVKSRMRSLAQSLTRKRMLHKVKDADVVIVNPTHIAIAIRYDGSESSAPVVLAMGRLKLAERIRHLAERANVPVVQNVAVARALISTATIGKPIPPALYAAVAEVLAFVYRQRGRLPGVLQSVRVR